MKAELVAAYESSSLGPRWVNESQELESNVGPELDLNAIEAANYGYFRHSATISVILVVAYTMVFVVGIVGNSFVVTVFCRSPRMRTVTNYFIANLAFADILVLLFCLPATLVGNLFIPYVLGLFVCKTVSYLQGVSVSASINTMVAVTLDRFLAICFPMDWHMSRRTARWTIACIWLFSLCISLPWALFFTLLPYKLDERTINVCTEDWPSERMGTIYFVCANLILLYLLPAVVIILCYMGIWYKIERRNIPGDRPKGLKIELIMQKSKLKVVKMMMVVVVIFLLSWLPLYLIFARIKLTEERSPWEDWLIAKIMPLAQWLGASNSCINPILYTFFNRKYKRGFIDLIRFGFCCKPALQESRNEPHKLAHSSNCFDHSHANGRAKTMYSRHHVKQIQMQSMQSGSPFDQAINGHYRSYDDCYCNKPVRALSALRRSGGSSPETSLAPPASGLHAKPHHSSASSLGVRKTSSARGEQMLARMTDGQLAAACYRAKRLPPVRTQQEAHCSRHNKRRTMAHLVRASGDSRKSNIYIIQRAMDGKKAKEKKKRPLSRSAGARSPKSNSTNTTRDTESTDMTAMSFTNGTTGNGANLDFRDSASSLGSVEGGPRDHYHEEAEEVNVETKPTEDRSTAPDQEPESHEYPSSASSNNLDDDDFEPSKSEEDCDDDNMLFGSDREESHLELKQASGRRSNLVNVLIGRLEHRQSIQRNSLLSKKDLAKVLDIDARASTDSPAKFNVYYLNECDNNSEAQIGVHFVPANQATGKSFRAQASEQPTTSSSTNEKQPLR